MCGIAGVIEPAGSPEPVAARQAVLESMIDLLGHRGPDEAGTFVDRRVAMAAVRLSIVDVAGGHQPMGDGTGRYWIVYNGEIYNHAALRRELEAVGHRFATRCDTEVALRAWIEWGADAPPRFDGGFAFAVYDRREGRVDLVRDRFGKRPLFYAVDGGAVVFGSEIKALRARPGRSLAWDPERLAAIFARWTPIGDETPYAGVRQVPAGSIVTVGVDRIAVARHGSFPVGLEPLAVGLDEAAERTREALADSVRRRLVGDVEVGVMVSGGLDSSVLAHLLRREVPDRIRAFSIRFADAAFDESEHQEALTGALDLSTTSIEVGADDVAGAFADALWHAEIPQFRTAFVPMFLLSRAIAAAGVKVVLSGEGADESFLGYNVFKETRLRAEWDRLEPAVRRDRIRGLYPYLPHFAEANVRALEGRLARTVGRPSEPLFSHALRRANGSFAARLLATGPPAPDALAGAIAGDPAVAALSPVRRAQWIEFHTLLEGYLLSSQGDRMTFAHGVEGRCPFLGPAVVELAARLPETYLLSDAGDEKHLLKRAFAADLPPAIAARPKQPYRAPDAAAFREPGGGLRPWVEDHLAGDQLRAVDVLDAAAAGRLVDKIRRTPADRVSPREDQAFVLLLSLVLLDRRFVRAVDGPPATRPVARRQPIDLTSEEDR